MSSPEHLTQQKSFLWIVLFALTVIGICLRLSHLNLDTLYFSDEGSYLGEAHLILDTSPSNNIHMGKPLHSFLIAASLLSKNEPLSALKLQAILSSLWIPMIFLITQYLFNSTSLSLMATLLATFDPWAYLYSRHLFPEPLSTLLWMLSLYLLIHSRRDDKKLYASGFFFGLAVTANYRMILLLYAPIVFILWEPHWELKNKIKNSLTWLGMSMTAPVCSNVLFWLLRQRSPQKNYPGYFSQFLNLFKIHSQYGLRFDSWDTYPSLLLHYEGFFLIAFLLAGIGVLSWSQSLLKESKKIFFLTFILPILAFSFSFFPFARTWSPILFWHPILAAIGIKKLADFSSRKISKSSLWVSGFFLIITLVSLLPRIYSIQKSAAPYQKAISWMAHQQPTASPLLFFSSNTLLLSQLTHTQEAWVLWLDSFIQEESLRKEAYREEAHYALIDQYQFIRTGSSISTKIAPPVDELKNRCQPVLSLDCENPKEFWTHFAWEHNVKSQETKNFLKEIEKNPHHCIDIYDLPQCFP